MKLARRGGSFRGRSGPFVSLGFVILAQDYPLRPLLPLNYLSECAIYGLHFQIQERMPGG